MLSEVQTTADDLDVDLGDGFYIGDADITCYMEFEAFDPGDHWTPPSGGCATMYDITVTKVTVYNSAGDEITSPVSNGLCKIAEDHLRKTDWMEKNEAWAAEQWSEDEQGRQEAALEAKFDAMREEGLRK